MVDRIRIALVFLIILNGCKSAKDSPKFNFADGVYHTEIEKVKQQVYIENTEDSIIVYSLKKGWKRLDLKSTDIEKKSYPHNADKKTLGANRYWQNGFDI